MYVEGFVHPAPTARREDYRRAAEIGAAVFKDKGALQVVERRGDDAPQGKPTSFPMAVRLEANETVAFSWIAWPDREARDVGMKAAMEDPRMQPLTADMPFDGKRMIFGGFEAIVAR